MSCSVHKCCRLWRQGKAVTESDPMHPTPPCHPGLSLAGSLMERGCVCVCDTWAKEQLPKHAEIILNNFEAWIVSSKGCIYPKESPFKHDHSPVFESIARAGGNLMTPWLWQHISKPRETAFSFFPTNKSPCRKLNSPRPSAYIFTLRVGSWRAVATEGLRDWSQPEAQSHLPVPLIAPQVLTAAFDTSQCSGAHSTLSS